MTIDARIRCLFHGRDGRAVLSIADAVRDGLVPASEAGRIARVAASCGGIVEYPVSASLAGRAGFCPSDEVGAL